MQRPRFSIIIPTLNEANFLPRLLTSLEAQKVKRFEIIIVDGGSTDKTMQIAAAYKKTLPGCINILSPHRGVSAQRNFGASLAKGEWLLFIDADSILLPYALERIERYIDENKPLFFTTWFRPDTEEVGDAMVTLLLNALFEGAQIVKRPFTQGTFAAVTRQIFLDIGGYDESLGFGEDYDLTKRIYKRGIPLHVLRETLYIYSLRRLRHQGTLKSMQMGARAVFSVLLTNKTPKNMPGYVMGGHPYRRKGHAHAKASVMKKINKTFQGLVHEFIDS